MRNPIPLLAALLCICNSMSGQVVEEGTVAMASRFELTDFDHDGVKDLYYLNNDVLYVASFDSLQATVIDQKNISLVNQIQAGDIDGDGFPEIIMTHDHTIRYFENDAGELGSLISLATTPFSAPDFHIAYIEDLDNDQDGDVIYHRTSGEVFVIENVNGDLDFDESIKIYDLDGLGGGSRMTFCDYNQDGLQDIIFYSAYRGIYVLLNEGSMSFDGDRFSQTWNPNAYHVADLNYDGYPDLIQLYRTSNQNPSGSIEVAINAFGDANGFYSLEGFYHPSSIDVENLDGDDLLEIIIADDQCVTVLDLVGSSIEREDVWGVPNDDFPVDRARVWVGDFDHDDTLEMLHMNAHWIGQSIPTLLGTQYGKSDDSETTCENLFDPGLCPQGDIVIASQQDITDLMNTYPFCTILNGGLRVSGQVSDLQELAGIRVVNGSLRISDVPADTLDLAGLAYVRDTLMITSNASLQLITGFGKLMKAKHLFIADNPQLTEVVGFAALTGECDVTLKNCTQIQSVTGFNNLSLPNVTLDNSPVAFMDWLKYADVFTVRNVTYPDNQFFGLLRPWNLVLEHVAGITSLESIDQNFDCRITLDSCDDLERIGAKVRLLELHAVNNPKLNDLSGSENQSVMWDLELRGNASLESIDGLEHINRMVGDVIIEDNAKLTDISGLTLGEPEIIDQLVIRDNPQLAICNSPWVCRFLELSANPYDISGNAGGCSDVNQVLEACGLQTSTNEAVYTPTVVVFPNPARHTLQIETSRQIRSIEIYDSSGTLVSSHGDASAIGIGHLSDGLYHALFAFDNARVMKRFVILR